MFITKHTDHEIKDLNAYTKYKIWVVACNQNGPGMNSLEVTVVTKPSAPTQPPQNIAVEAVSSTVYFKSYNFYLCINNCNLY